MNGPRRRWPVAALAVALLAAAFLSGCALTKDCTKPSERFDANTTTYQTEAQCEKSKTDWLITVLVVFGGGGTFLYFVTRVKKD